MLSKNLEIINSGNTVIISRNHGLYEILEPRGGPLPDCELLLDFHNILFCIRGSTKQGILEWNHKQKTGQTLAKWNSSISDEICELIIKEMIREHLKEDTHTNQLQYGFTQTKSCQTNSISSFNRVSSLIGQGIVETLQTGSEFHLGIWQIFWGSPCWRVTKISLT